MGFVVGPLTLAPLSDLYGRLPSYRIYIILYIVFTIACAVAPTLETLILFRFLAGCMGGAPMAMGRAVVADLYGPKDRIAPMASYSFGVIMAPAVGPVVGGITTGKMGWRWVFWITTILVRIQLAIYGFPSLTSHAFHFAWFWLIGRKAGIRSSGRDLFSVLRDPFTNNYKEVLRPRRPHGPSATFSFYQSFAGFTRPSNSSGNTWESCGITSENRGSSQLLRAPSHDMHLQWNHEYDLVLTRLRFPR